MPDSHVVNWIDGPPRRDIQWPDPEGAIEVTAEPGDAVFLVAAAEHQDNYAEYPAHQQIHDLEQHPASQPSLRQACWR